MGGVASKPPPQWLIDAVDDDLPLTFAPPCRPACHAAVPTPAATSASRSASRSASQRELFTESDLFPMLLGGGPAAELPGGPGGLRCSAPSFTIAAAACAHLPTQVVLDKSLASAWPGYWSPNGVASPMASSAASHESPDFFTQPFSKQPIPLMA